jgi:hypothetical protein
MKLLGAGAAGAAGLGSLNTAAADGHVARVRVVHAVPDAPAVDVYANDVEVISGAEFKDATGYLEVEPGTTTVDVTPAGETPDAAVASAELTVEGGTSYTVVAAGELDDGSIEVLPFVDETSVGGSFADSNASVRIVHAVPDLQDADLTVTVFNDNPDQEFVDVPEGVRSDLLGLVDLFQATPTERVPQFIRDRIRTPGLLQFLADVPEVLVRLTLFDDVSFGTASDYLQVPAGEYGLTIREALDDETPVDPAIDDVRPVFVPSTVYTVIAVGYATAGDEPADESLDAVVVTSE